MAIIIAEAGINHNGSLSEARRLALAARDAGADVVKYQYYRAGEVTQDPGHHAMLLGYQLTLGHLRHLKDYCDVIGIRFMCSAFSVPCARSLVEVLGVDAIKVGSGEITNIRLLRGINKLDTPVILSTGMSNYIELQEALWALQSVPSLVVMHCVSAYPAPIDDVNIRVIPHLGRWVHNQHVMWSSSGVGWDGVPTTIGYSDHTIGTEAILGAVALGATHVEKHLTLRRSQLGPDHASSMEPTQFRLMVDAIREMEAAMGKPVKGCQPSEEACRRTSRRRLVTDVTIPKGSVICEDALRCYRPLSDGVPAGMMYRVAGKRAARHLPKGHTMRLGDWI